jgi:hypothetical protein
MSLQTRPPSSVHIAPGNKAFDAYATMLADFRDRKVTNEGAVR